MNQLIVSVLLGLSVLLLPTNNYPKAKDVVEKSIDNYTSLNAHSLFYTNTQSKYYHSFTPFQTYSQERWGEVLFTQNNEHLFLYDTIKKYKDYPNTKVTVFNLDTYNYSIGDKGYADTVYNEKHKSFFFYSFAYTPYFALKYFQDMEDRHFESLKETNNHYVVTYNHEDYKDKISLYIHKETYLVEKIENLTDHNPWGDHLQTYSYKDYLKHEDFNYAQHVTLVERDSVMNDIHLRYDINDKSTVMGELSNEPMMIVEPSGEYSATYTKYNDMIHFIDFLPYEDRTVLVEFDSFVFVINAPLYASNSIEIKRKVREHIGKPIKYFSFGHHHPDYIGGIRAFADPEINIVCHESVKDYIDFVITNPRTINPYFYGFNPKKKGYSLTTYDTLKVIKDANHEMQMLYMGEKSEHTIDYTVFYFPEYNLLIEDDLIFVGHDLKRKPVDREIGLYEFINTKGIEVDSIIQNYPVGNNKYKTSFTYQQIKERNE